MKLHYVRIRGNKIQKTKLALEIKQIKSKNKKFTGEFGR